MLKKTGNIAIDMLAVIGGAFLLLIGVLAIILAFDDGGYDDYDPYDGALCEPYTKVRNENDKETD